MPIYLDNAATSFPKPESVYQAMDDCLRNHGGAFARSAHATADRVRNIVGDCRQATAAFIDAPSPTHVVFTLNCTDSLNLVLQGLLSNGDRVVTTALEHNSVLRPLHQLAMEHDLTIRTVGFDAGTGMVDGDEFRRELAAAETALVAITHASNVTGCVQPVRQLIDLAHSSGALVLLDAAQTIGHTPFSMTQLDADFVATAGHKGLMGPLGTGVLAMKPGLESQLRPYRSGGTGTDSESPYQPETMPCRFESGNLNVPGLAGLKAGIEWLQKQTIEQVSEHTTSLTSQLRDGLSQIANLRCFPNARNSDRTQLATGIVSFMIDGMDSRDIGMILDQSFDIQCRTGLHCAPLVHRILQTERSGGTVRFSVGPFNTRDHISAAITAVDQIATTAI
jgi:cysteine desulfurase / selenocysteine lyase